MAGGVTVLKKLFCLITSVTVLLCLSVTALANSAQTYWSGVDRSGAIVNEENCPLVVEGEKLSFDIPEFPQNYYQTAEDYLNYSASVTAEYTFKNPADYKVNATLVFPFGRAPDYACYDEEKGYSYDGEKFDVVVNSKAIKKKLRHTFYSYDEFDYKTESTKLKDNYTSDEFFSPDTPVKVYVFEPSGIDEAYFLDYDSPYISAPLATNPDKTRILLSDCISYDYRDDNVYAGLYPENNISFTMYVIGEDIDFDVDWTVYENASAEKEIGGEVKLLFTDDSTFEDIALMFHRGESGISEVDWYNALVDKINYYEYEYGFLGSDYEFMIGQELMRWYEYELSVEPKQTITNTVTAPIYPTINGDYEPPKYEYKYLLSPAQNWADFKKLDIEINSQYYLIKSNLGKFKHSGDKYTLSLDSLPKKECEFTLCSATKPKKISRQISLRTILPIIMFGLFLLIPIAIIVVLVSVIVDSRKRKKKKKE